MVLVTHPQQEVQLEWKKDMPLILNNNRAVGVTYEATEINYFYKQIQKHPHFVKHLNLYHEKGRPNNHRTGSIR